MQAARGQVDGVDTLSEEPRFELGERELALRLDTGPFVRRELVPHERSLHADALSRADVQRPAVARRKASPE